MARTNTKRPAPAPQGATQAAQPTAPQLDGLQRAQAVTETQLKEAGEVRDQLLKELAAGRDVHAQLASIEQESAGLEAKRKRLADARALEAQNNTRAARDARRRLNAESVKSALADAQTLGEQVKDTLIAIAELGARLSAIRDVRDSINARIANACVDDNSRDYRHIEQHVAQLRNALQALTLPDHFLRSLWGAGVGRTGITLTEPWFSIAPLSGMYKNAGTDDPDEVIADAIKRLRTLAQSAMQVAA